MNNPSQKSRRPPLSESQWQSIVADWRASGLSVSAYARKHGVAAHGLWKWRHRFGAERSEADAMRRSSPGPSFLKVEVAKTDAAAPAYQEGSTVELLLPGGYVVRLHGSVSSGAVSAILRGIQEAQRC